MEKITLGSLFDGIGVFPLAATLHGITPLWASEIEKAPISITRRHFPEMEHQIIQTRKLGTAAYCSGSELRSYFLGVGGGGGVGSL